MSIVLHIPHSSKRIPDEYIRFFNLSTKDLQIELLKMTDHFTDELFDICNIHLLKFPISRLLVDVERFEIDELEPMSKVGMGCIYEKTHDGKSLKNIELIKHKLIKKYYKKHHEKFTKIVETMLEEHNKVLIVDCHSFPKYPLPYELIQNMVRPEICIGTDDFHTSKRLKLLFEEIFKNLNFSVKTNNPFKGSIVPLKFYKKDKRVQSVMIEVRRDLYMDEISGGKNQDFKLIQNKLTHVINKVFKKY